MVNKISTCMPHLEHPPLTFLLSWGVKLFTCAAFHPYQTPTWQKYPGHAPHPHVPIRSCSINAYKVTTAVIRCHSNSVFCFRNSHGHQLPQERGRKPSQAREASLLSTPAPRGILNEKGRLLFCSRLLLKREKIVGDGKFHRFVLSWLTLLPAEM